MKNKGKETNKDREFGVILEKIDSNIKIICEDISTLKGRMDGIAANQAATLEKVTLLELRFKSLDATVKTLDATVKTLDATVKTLDATVKTIQADIAEIKTDLKSHTHLEAAK